LLRALGATLGHLFFSFVVVRRVTCKPFVSQKISLSGWAERHFSSVVATVPEIPFFDFFFSFFCALLLRGIRLFFYISFGLPFPPFAFFPAVSTAVFFFFAVLFFGFFSISVVFCLSLLPPHEFLNWWFLFWDQHPNPNGGHCFLSDVFFVVTFPVLKGRGSRPFPFSFPFVFFFFVVVGIFLFLFGAPPIF